jgi:hypothetical protein
MDSDPPDTTTPNHHTLVPPFSCSLMLPAAGAEVGVVGLVVGAEGAEVGAVVGLVVGLVVGAAVEEPEDDEDEDLYTAGPGIGYEVKEL